MKKYSWIGIGGMLGALSRYGIGTLPFWGVEKVFPVNTLLVNVTGSFLLLLILTIAFEVLAFDPDVRLGITTGFLGAYTTFSTFCKEMVELIFNGEYLWATCYMMGSVLLGLAFATLGFILAKKIIHQMTVVE